MLTFVVDIEETALMKDDSLTISTMMDGDTVALFELKLLYPLKNYQAFIDGTLNIKIPDNLTSRCTIRSHNFES